jgi:hypothetical protein
MTRDDIFRMAREADLYEGSDDQVIRFAFLVAAAEREKVAVWMIQRSYATGHGDTTEDLLQELEWQVRESEREACAKVCDVLADKHTFEGGYANECAIAIRERGAP